MVRLLHTFLCVPSLMPSLPEEGRVRKTFHQAKPGLKTRKKEKVRDKCNSKQMAVPGYLLPGLWFALSSEQDKSVQHTREAVRSTRYASALHSEL